MKKTFVGAITLGSLVLSLLGATPAFAALGTPDHLIVVGGQYTNDVTPTFTWSAVAGATWYEVLLDTGSWESVGNVTSYTAAKLTDGWHGFYVRAKDSTSQTGPSTEVVFEIDTKGPWLNIASPSSATQNVETTIIVDTSSDDVPATWCSVSVNGGKWYDMTAQNTTDPLRHKSFTLPYTFYTSGSFTVNAKCGDGDGNESVGAAKTVSVSRNSVPTPAVPTVAKGTVVKTACGSYAPKADRCHSIYYYGTDGKRHAFTSEAVYLSWFANYANVVTVSNATMDAMPTGENVTMRPGTMLVKFAEKSTVYAVEKAGVLRPIMNEAAARAIYGNHWNSLVVTLSGSVKGDYTFGANIWGTGDYSKFRAYYSVTSIDQNF